jgi:ribosomal protein L11 methyltransferase
LLWLLGLSSPSANLYCECVTLTSNWWEIQVWAVPDLEDQVFWRLQTLGCQGISSQLRDSNHLFCGYLPQRKVQPLDLAALGLWIEQDAIASELPPPRVNWQLISEEDWATSWQQYWHPQEVGDRLLIYPAWLERPEKCDRHLLLLNPGVAFGTGAHATTQLCLEALEMQLDDTFDPLGDVTIADIGCGTGILAIAALFLGAKQAYAVDTDPLAVESAARSRELNQIAPERMIILEGSFEKIPQPVDGIVCNILADVIISLVPKMTSITKPGTWAIFSGILLEQAQKVTESLEQNGWSVGCVWRKEDWCCLNAQRR